VTTYNMLVYEDEEDGGYWAKVAELPGCYTTGESIEEIRKNVHDAIVTHLEALEFAGEDPPPVPVDVEKVAV
jgi:predicted RNase H-like HicB family nuclease